MSTTKKTTSSRSKTAATRKPKAASKPKASAPSRPKATKPAPATAAKAAGTPPASIAKTAPDAAAKPAAPVAVVKDGPAESVATAEMPVVSKAETVVSGPVMRKRELIEAVVKRTGVKKRDAKPVIEAALDLMGDALHEGRELNLQPMGNMKVRKARALRKGQVLMTKIRQPGRTLPDAAE